jgi:iron complex transport system ATP-binding protein
VSASVIEVHVETHYRLGVPRPILSDVHWTVHRGEHWALVGANGAGKSTLLSIVAGDPWPSRGVVRVLGEEYGKVDKRILRRRIGVVSSAMVERFPAGDSALDVVASGLHARIGRWGPTPDDEAEQARAALAEVRAETTREKPYGVLSQGERQRVMIARALIARPDLLILDEPCAGLDPGARERFIADLSHLAARGGPTQVVVTHHLEEIPPHVSHALLLHEGAVLARGPVDEVLRDELLTQAFGAPCHVQPNGAGPARRFTLTVRATT